MDALELMLRRSQYICVLALVNARFSILKKKQKPTKRRTKRFWIREYLKKTGEIWSVPHTVFRVKPIRSDREYFFRYIRMSPKRNRRYPRSSGMDRDKSGESGAFLFSRRVPDFCDGRRSFPRNENSNLYRRDVGDGFRSLPIPKIAGLQSPYHK